MDDVKKLRAAMRLFYLSPGYGLFVSICGEFQITSDYGEYFIAWKDACIATYGDIWGINMNASPIYELLSVDAHENPNIKVFMKSLFAFYASGDQKYTDLCYTTIVLGKFSRAEKDNLLQMTEKI